MTAAQSAANSSVEPITLGDLRLVHYSSRVVTKVRSSRQNNLLGFKPDGFWLSVDNFEPNWRTWCEGEDFNVRNLKIPHEVRLREDAKILWLRTAENIDELNAAYQVPYEPDRDISRRVYRMDWKRLAENCQGIIIAPYQWSRRYCKDFSWYYSWDCASGCIWDARAIESILPVPSANLEAL